MTRTVVVIQARMGSRRFPGKSLADVAGRPMLSRAIARAERIDGVNEVIVATSVEPADDPLARAAASFGARVFRGSLTNVLDRFYRAAEMADADVVVRVTADCPLLDPAVSSTVVGRRQDASAAYASNVHPPTFPDGLDTEAMTREALNAAWRAASLAADKEHVTPFLWRQPDRFPAVTITHDIDLSAHRWTVDEADDLQFVNAILSAFDPADRDRVGMDDVLGLLAARPDVAKLATSHVRNAGSMPTPAPASKLSNSRKEQ